MTTHTQPRWSTRTFRTSFKLVLVATSIALTSLRGAESGETLGEGATGDGGQFPNTALNFQTDLFTGRFAYGIPISVPPARQGSQPALTLGYNSASGNSWCGVGWNLEVGFIQRDGRQGVPVKWNLATGTALQEYDDTKGFLFAMNGVSARLRRVSTDPVYPREYRAEVNSTFLRFQYWDQETSPYWEVIDTSGNHFFFGESSTSRVQNPKWTNEVSKLTYRWALSRVTDINGNQTTLTYTTDGGTLYLSTIDYNANINAVDGSTNSPTHHVEFGLGSRQDTNINFQAGFRMVQARRLSNIVVSVSGALVRRYDLGYTQSSSTLRSLLLAVTNIGADGTSIAPIQTFQYSRQNPDFASVVTWTNVGKPSGSSTEWYSVRRKNSDATGAWYTGDLIDMDRDGLPDRVMRKFSSPYTNYFSVQRNTGAGFQSPSGLYQWKPLDSQGNTADQWNTPSSFNTDGGAICLVMDINGDGFPDRIMRNDASPYTNFWVQLNNVGGCATNFAAAVKWTGVDAEDSARRWRTARTSTNGSIYVELADINGDGLPDRILRTKDSPFNHWKVQFNTGSNFLGLCNWVGVDGQGSGAYAWNSINLNNSFYGADGNWTYVVLRDINGDGLPDRVMANIALNGSDWVVQFNNGAGFETNEYWRGFASPSGAWPGSGVPAAQAFDHQDAKKTIAALYDWNADGLVDRLVQVDDGATNPPTYSKFYVQFNTGTCFSPTFTVITNVDLMGGKGGYISRISGGNTTMDLMDMNGDGLPDRVNSPQNGTYDVQTALGPVPDLLIGASNGIGGSVAVAYVPATLWNNRDKDSGMNPLESNAVSQLNIPFQTVSKLLVNDGFGPVTNSYSYVGGYYNYKQREFRGFSFVEVTDSFGAKKRHYFHQSGGRDESLNGEYQDQSALAKHGMPYRIDTLGADGKLYASTLNKVEETLIDASGSTFPFIAQTINLTYEGLGTNYYRATANQLLYDTNGNLLQEIDFGEVTNVNCAAHSFADAQTGDNVYKHISITSFANVNIRNKPYSIKLTSDSGGLSVLRDTRLYYDARGNLTNQQQWLDGNFFSTSLIKYDAQGNPIEITDSAGINTIHQYDSTYRLYPVLKISQTFTNQAIIDVRSGSPISVVDAKGLITSNIYDAFFRLIESRISTNAYGAASLWREKVDYVQNGFVNQRSTNYVRRRVYDAVDLTNGHETYVYSDGLGRALQTRVEAETGDFRVSARFYDDRGNVFFETLPFFDAGTNYLKLAGTSKLGTWTDFDAVGRAFKVTPALSVTFDSNGGFQSTTSTGGDAGSPVGSVTNSFVDGMNPWASVVADSENKMRKSYRDGFGRVIQLVEVTSGGNYNTYFKYDLLGNLTNVTDHAGNITTMMYDTLGRKTNMIEPNMGSWNYRYDIASRLTEQTDAKGQKIKMFYLDPLGRLSRKELYNSAGSKVASITNIYDAQDDGDATFSVAKGELYKVYDGEGWHKMSYDPRGRVVKATRYLAINGISYTTQTTYDDADRAKTVEYPLSVAKIRYDYDSAGNLTNIISLSGTATQEVFYSRPVFNEVGQVTSFKMRHGGTITTNLYYANSKRLKQTRAFLASGGDHQDLNYTYDKVSNVRTITNALYSSFSFTSLLYDDLHRIAQATTASGTKNYAYNPIGNMLTNGDAGTGLYSYGAKPHAVASANGETYYYDANGNMTNRNGQTLVYNEENRLVSSSGGGYTTVTFGYADSGARLWKSGPSGLTVWIGGIYEKLGSGRTLCHVFAGGQRIATFEPQGGLFGYINKPKMYADTIDRILAAAVWPLQKGRTPWTVSVISLLGVLFASIMGRRLGNARRDRALKPVTLGYQGLSVLLIVAVILGTTPIRVEAQVASPVFYYYHNDHLGSSNVLTDRYGVRVDWYEYTTYGDVRFDESTTAVPMSQRYTGQILDEDTGLYFYNARYYDPGLGRFVQPDTVVPKAGDSQALNRYSYVANNPFRYVDPTGHFWEAIIIGVIIGAALGAATAAATGGDIAMGALTGAISGLFGGLGAVWGGLGTAMIMGATAGAVNASITGGDVGMGALTGAIAGGISFGVGRLAMLTAKAAGLRAASLGNSLVQGATGGAAGGAVGAAINGGDIGEGALIGGASGTVAAGAKWGYNRTQAERFLQGNVRGNVTPAVRQAILDAGQSPIGQRLMNNYLRTGAILEIGSENNSPHGPGRGPHVTTGSNRMYFDGNAQARLGGFIAGEPWGPTFDDATFFVHELGHTASGFGHGDPLNVAHSENVYRAWAGSPARGDYGVLSQGQASQPVPSRGVFANTFHPWY